MDTVSQILAKRDKLAEERDRVRARLTKIEDELRELEIAASVIARFSGENNDDASYGPSPTSKSSKILAILRSVSPAQYQLEAVMGRYEQVHGEALERNTARVSLSRLQERGLVKEDPVSRGWFYTGPGALPHVGPSGTGSGAPDDTPDFLK